MEVVLAALDVTVDDIETRGVADVLGLTVVNALAVLLGDERALAVATLGVPVCVVRGVALDVPVALGDADDADERVDETDASEDAEPVRHTVGDFDSSGERDTLEQLDTLREMVIVPVALTEAETREDSDDVFVDNIDAEDVCVTAFTVAVGFDEDDDEIESETNVDADESTEVVAHADVVALVVPVALATAEREMRVLDDGVRETLGDVDGEPVTTDAVALRVSSVDGELEMLPVPLRVARGEREDDIVPECEAVFTGDADGDVVKVNIDVVVCVGKGETEGIIEPVTEPV